MSSTRHEHRNYLDWNTFKERIDIVEVAAHLFPDSEIDTTVNCRSLFCWCPFHQDRNKKSLALFREIRRFKCYACNERGDAATLVMRQKGVSFPDAIRFLHDNFLRENKKRTDFSRESTVSAPSQHSVLTGEEALKLVSEPRKLLHSSPGSTELRYLVEFRFFSWETVEKRQLGWVRDLEIPTEDGRSLLVSGLVIPCYSDRGELVQVKIRKLPMSQTKYLEVFSSEKFQCYPNPAHIKVGKPLIVVGGELDCLLLQQILEDMASVITCGSESRTREPWYLSEMLLSPV